MKLIYFFPIIIFTQIVNAQNFKSNLIPSAGSLKEYNANAKVVSPMHMAAGITCSQQYTSGVSQTFSLVLNITNFGGEYGDSLSITFPAGFTINSALPNDSIGVAEAPTPAQSGCPNTESGTKEPYKGIFGQSVVWGNDDNCYGGLRSANYTTTISITATIGSGVSGPQIVNFHLSGDEYGGNAGDYDGIFIIYETGSVIHDFKTNSVYVLTSPGHTAHLDNCSMGMHTVHAEIQNVGNITESNISGYYYSCGVVFGPFSIAAAIVPGGVQTISFPVPYDFTPSGIYNLKAWVNISGEINHNQDTAFFNLSNTNPTPLTTTTYYNGIESSYEYGSLNLDWIGSGAAFSLNANSHSGIHSLDLTIPNGLGIPLGAYTSYINLPCVDVIAGETYRISFWKRVNNSPLANGKTGIRTGLEQEATYMTTSLKALTPVTIFNTWIKDSVDYTATANETRYFAIQGSGNLTNSSQINVLVDDIKIAKVLNTVGISTNKLELFSISPNPTSGLISIDNNNLKASVEIFNINGELVTLNSSLDLSIGRNILDLSELSNGTYVIKIDNGHSIVNKKLIIIK